MGAPAPQHVRDAAIAAYGKRSMSIVAAELGVSTGAVSHWWAKARRDGVVAPLFGRHTGGRGSSHRETRHSSTDLCATKRLTRPVLEAGPIDVATRLVGGTCVSLARMPSLDDLDPRGTWGPSTTTSRPSGRDVTAALMGDPEPGRSALATRAGGEAGRSP